MPIAAITALLPDIEPGLVLAWLGTYLLHSTLLLGAAWAASRLLRGRALGVEEGLWKAALVGGLLTASLQVGLGVAAPGDAGTESAAVASVPAPAGLQAPRLAAAGTGAPAVRPAADPRLRTFAAVLPGWQRLALAGWAFGAALLAVGLALSWLRLRLRLRGRSEVAAGPARLLLDRLLGRLDAPGCRRVRLTGTPALPVPVALGVGEREICLPRRALTELGERRQRGLLAHELAHLERRDPAWLLGARAVESLFFFQPLNRLARARLQEISELRCDEWAVAATGDRIGLARCLTEVAGWLAEGRAPLAVPGMARTRKNLGERVRRILEGGGEEGAADRRWLPAAAAALLLAGAALVPGVAPESFATPQEPEAQEPAEAQPATPPAEEAPAAPEGEPGAWADPEPEWHEDEGRDFEDEDYDFDFDYDFAFDHDFDYDFDFDFEAMAEAMAAAHAAMPDAAEMARIHEEMERAMREAEGSMPDAAEIARLQEEMERALREAHESMPDAAEMARLHEELGRVNHHLRDEVERELRQAREELERANREVRREMEEARRELDLERRELEEHRREMEHEMEEARRELEERQHELHERRQELEERRRELEERRQELREERDRRREEEPPAS
jgi:beta-lactamase regulating signal transducer with metallopeptidase domain